MRIIQIVSSKRDEDAVKAFVGRAVTICDENNIDTFSELARKMDIKENTLRNYILKYEKEWYKKHFGRGIDPERIRKIEETHRQLAEDAVNIHNQNPDDLFVDIVKKMNVSKPTLINALEKHKPGWYDDNFGRGSMQEIETRNKKLAEDATDTYNDDPTITFTELATKLHVNNQALTRALEKYKPGWKETFDYKSRPKLSKTNQKMVEDAVSVYNENPVKTFAELARKMNVNSDTLKYNIQKYKPGWFDEHFIVEDRQQTVKNAIDIYNTNANITFYELAKKVNVATATLIKALEKYKPGWYAEHFSNGSIKEIEERIQKLVEEAINLHNDNPSVSFWDLARKMNVVPNTLRNNILKYRPEWYRENFARDTFQDNDPVSNWWNKAQEEEAQRSSKEPSIDPKWLEPDPEPTDQDLFDQFDQEHLPEQPQTPDEHIDQILETATERAKRIEEQKKQKLLRKYHPDAHPPIEDWIPGAYNKPWSELLKRNPKLFDEMADRRKKREESVKASSFNLKRWLR